MTPLENKLSRIRKLDEMIDELSDALATLKGERDSLTNELTPALIADKSVFNVFKHKNLSAGLIGRNYFAVSFPTALARKGGRRMDDQEWLKDFCWATRNGYEGKPYIREKYELDKAKITADYRSGEIDDDFMAAYGLEWQKTAKLSVLKCRTDAEVKDLIAEAERMAEVVE